ncbi:MAG: hypothetical protein ACP5RM_02220 [Candidatus Micrarchaeia archaeon]
MLALLPLLSLGAIYTFIPIIIILILIAAAAGLTRGMDVFALFGIGTLMGMASGGSRGAGKGLTSGNKYKATPAKYTSVAAFASAGKGVKAIQKTQKENKKIQANTINDLIKSGSIIVNGVPVVTNTKTPLVSPQPKQAGNQKGIKMSLSPSAAKRLQKNINKMQGNGVGARDVLNAASAGIIKGTKQRAAEKVVSISKKGIANQHLIDEKGWGIRTSSLVTALGIVPASMISKGAKNDLDQIKDIAKKHPGYKDLKESFIHPNKKTPIIGPYYELYSYAKKGTGFLASIHSKNDFNEHLHRAADMWRAKRSENYYATGMETEEDKGRPFILPRVPWIPLPVDINAATKNEYVRRKELAKKKEEFSKEENDLQLRIDALKKVNTPNAQEELRESSEKMSALKKEHEEKLKEMQDEYEKAYREKVDAYASISGQEYLGIMAKKIEDTERDIQKATENISKYSEKANSTSAEGLESHASAWAAKRKAEEDKIEKLNEKKEYYENLVLPLKQKLIYEHFNEPGAYIRENYDNVNKPSKEDVKRYYWDFGAVPTYMNFSSPNPSTPKGDIPSENDFYAKQWRIHQKVFREQYKKRK